ncbi:MAG: discoidin domain-containing protein [Cytophagales bacterium]|nr:discoidin domain-containing protein [Cytophaga sp.]
MAFAMLSQVVSAQTTTIYGLTVMVDYPDLPFRNSIDSVSLMMNQTGFSGWGSMGSVKDFYYTQSNGKVTITSQVIKVSLSGTSDYYHGTGGGANVFVPDVIAKINEQFPAGFQNLSIHPDGGLWNFAILSKNGGQSHTIGSNSYILNNGQSLLVNRGSLTFYGGENPSINTICHESGHSIMGWTDYYRTEFCNLGDYDVMASAGTTKAPMPINPALRLQKGWINDVVNVTGTTNITYTLTANSYTQVHKYTNPNNPKEYLLFHALKHGGYYQPVLDNGKVLDQGLAIWYVDEDCGFEQPGIDTQYFIRLVQADNKDEMHDEFNPIPDDVRGDLNDLYDNVSNAFPNGTPFHWKDGGEFGISISNISAPGTTMSFTVTARPNTVVASTDLNGTMSPKGTLSVASGQNVNFTFIPNPGYELDVVTVNGAPVTATSPYTLTGIAGTKTIRATYKKKVTLDPLPSPWQQANIGNPKTGFAVQASGKYSIESYGNDLNATSDNFGYIFQTLNGDGFISAKVTASNIPSWAGKEGIMLRESLDPNSAFSAIGHSISNGLIVFQRAVAGAQTISNPEGVPNLHKYNLFLWYKIARVGTTVSSYCSRDGVTWVLIQQENLPLSSSLYVGMFATGASIAGNQDRASFENITVATTNPSPTVSITSPVNNATFTNPAAITINATAADANGSVAKVDFYNGTTLLGSDNTAPYSFIWNTQIGGRYTLYAKATDNQGAVTTSIPVSIVVPCGFTDPKIIGTAIGTPGSWGNTGNGFEKAFDNDVSTYFDAPEDIAWAGLSLPKDYKVTGINYYPRQDWADRMVGGKFQGSNTADFSSGVVDLATITTQPLYEWTCITITNASSFRYIRYICGAGGVGNVAEIEFYGVSNTTPNLALNKPTYATTVENAGGLAKFATDGNSTSRWSSINADPQSLIVNLGAQYNINRVKITWEAAYGKDYQVQVSPDSVSWTTIKPVTGNTALTNDWTSLTGTGKYVKILGTARGTVYGYSIYELEVYGTAATNNQPPLVSITTPANNFFVSVGSTITIGASASDPDGSISKVEFYGGSTLINTATAAPYTILWPATTAGTYTITAKAYDNAGAITTSAPVTVTVNAVASANLALNKTATASSASGANTAAKAVDGNSTGTRWESVSADPQWIYVDLGAVYNVNRVKITWEPAYGKDYRVEVSNDLNNWGTPVKAVTGNTTLVNDWTGLSGTGQYVRIYGTARGTGYGYSIFELEVYGTAGTNNTPPTVSITNPVSNYTTVVGNSINITATAADANGSVTKVELYNGASVIGTITSTPYLVAWTAAAVGSYTFTAKAYDNQGAITTSAPISVTVTAATATNLALNKTATSSSTTGGNTAAKAVDGNSTGTRWESVSADPQWIYVDLGAVYNVNRVKITWEPAYGKDYRVEVSNDINNWGTPVKTVTGNTTLVNDWTGLSGTGRYVRIYGTARGTGYGYSIFELEIYGSSAARFADVGEEAVSGLHVFPNPFTEVFTIQAQFKVATAVDVIIFNALGTIVSEQHVENKDPFFEYNISNIELPTGVYLLKVVSGDEVFAHTLIKQ